MVSLRFLLVILALVFISCAIVSVESRKNHVKKSSSSHKYHHKKQKKGHENGGGPAQPPLPQCDGQSSFFDISSFGARGDGVSDDSKALLAAWKAACKTPEATILIPSHSKFLIKPLSLQGPCMPNLILQIDGTLLAPSRVGSWPKSSLFQWLNIKWVQNFTIQGSGTLDGQGSKWWTTPTSKHMPTVKPTALRFYASNNVTVRDIAIVNSPQCHLKFDNSVSVKVNNITITAPESSPNTDGIHLQNTQDVEIHHSNIGCGDDCVSIQTGCSNVHVHDINCGPGHGISLGGLGKDQSVACVSNVVIENIIMENTLYGARIKTWQGGIGSVKNVSFSNIQVKDVEIPVAIDQYYCDKGFCKNQTEAIAISGVKFDRIIGTYSLQPVHLACSDRVPCIDVDLIDVQLRPSPVYRGFRQALCWSSYGKSQTPLVPSAIDSCLMREGDLVRRISRSHDHIC